MYFVAVEIVRFIGFNRPRLVILYYHSLPPAKRAAFARQLDAVQSGCDAVVPADFSGPAVPGQLFVAITFDDAFTSVVENALPELAARGMPSTLFAPPGLLAQSPSWEMEEEHAQDRRETVASRDTLRAVAGDLVAIGAHSVTHPRLPRVDREAAVAEIFGSKEQLERMLEREVTLFAFPFGEYNDELLGLCRGARYRHAFTIVPRVIDPTTDSFVRGRVPVSLDDGALEFWLKMRGGYSWMPRLSRLRSWLSPNANNLRIPSQNTL